MIHESIGMGMGMGMGMGRGVGVYSKLVHGAWHGNRQRGEANDA